MLSIGDLSKRTGVKIPTIRYYEKMGLINAPSRSEGNQRRYTQQGMEQLSFIRHARELGFSIEGIRELLALSVDENRSCSEAHDIAAQHLKSVKERIAKLRRLQKELKRIQAMSDEGSIGKCIIIQSLADHSLCNAEH